MKRAGEESIRRKRPRRSVGAMWLAAPSLIALVAGGLLTAVLLARSAAGDADWYVARSEQALESGDYQTAAVGYGRLLQQHPADPRAAAGLEASLRGLGQAQEAEALHHRFAESIEFGRQPTP